MRLLVALVCGMAWWPSSVAAQATYNGDIAVLGANVLVGGLTSAVGAWLSGAPVVEALGKGVAGGSVQYLGKRLVTVDAPGAGLAGRLVAAAGASMVRNGVAGRDLLAEFVFPLGPVTLYWKTVPDSGSVRARVHLGRTIFLARMLAKDDLELDWSETLSSGAPVLHAPGEVIEGEDGVGIGGLELWGTVALSDPMLLPMDDSGRMLAHERVHVLQDDFLNVVWGDPLDDWLLERVPGGGFVGRYVDLGIAYIGAAAAMTAAVPYEERPWEREAAYLETGW
ncbi:MAG TPA: hypothetical protein VF188_07600 [Longimicrobiales bacterium]